MKDCTELFFTENNEMVPVLPAVIIIYQHQQHWKRLRIKYLKAAAEKSKDIKVVMITFENISYDGGCVGLHFEMSRIFYYNLWKRCVEEYKILLKS